MILKMRIEQNNDRMQRQLERRQVAVAGDEEREIDSSAAFD